VEEDKSPHEENERLVRDPFYRANLFALLRQIPGFAVGLNNAVSDGNLYRVVVSKENADLLRQETGWIVRPYLRRNGRFVENVRLVRAVPPDLAGTLFQLSIQAGITELYGQLARLSRQVAQLTALTAQANRGQLQGALDAIDTHLKLHDPEQRRAQTIMSAGNAMVALGGLIGQMQAHVDMMPEAKTTFRDGWDSKWTDKAKAAYNEVRGDFALILCGFQRVLAAYCTLGEYDAAYRAFESFAQGIERAGLQAAWERSRPLPYSAENAPEEAFSRFLASRHYLTNIAAGQVPLELEFTLEELLKGGEPADGDAVPVLDGAGEGPEAADDASPGGLALNDEGGTRPCAGCKRCGRALLATEKALCPNCRQLRLASWKVPLAQAAKVAQPAIPIVLSLAGGFLAKGKLRPR
jgi:hypothetical protein